VADRTIHATITLVTVPLCSAPSMLSARTLRPRVRAAGGIDRASAQRVISLYVMVASVEDRSAAFTIQTV
jgi:hypothetical protein